MQYHELALRRGGSEETPNLDYSSSKYLDLTLGRVSLLSLFCLYFAFHFKGNQRQLTVAMSARVVPVQTPVSEFIAVSPDRMHDR